MFLHLFLFGRAGAAAETTHANKYRRRAVGLYAAMAGSNHNGAWQFLPFRISPTAYNFFFRQPFSLQSLTHALRNILAFRGEAPDSLVLHIPRAAIFPRAVWRADRARASSTPSHTMTRRHPTLHAGLLRTAPSGSHWLVALSGTLHTRGVQSLVANDGPNTLSRRGSRLP